MLVKLLPANITRQWEVLSYALRHSLPPMAEPDTENRLGRILEQLLDDRMQCWVEAEEQYDQVVIYCFCFTTLAEDFVSGTRNLMIYALYGLTPMDDQRWYEAYQTLRKYAAGLGCYRIEAYTANDRVVDIVKHLGGKAEYQFVTLEVNN